MGEESVEERILKLEAEIAAIHARNIKVEEDKSWETSRTRLLSVALVTFVFTSLVFFTLDLSYPVLNALLATACYILSTLSLPLIRKLWVQKRRSRF